MPQDNPGRSELIERHHWLTFLLPFAVYMVATALEPSPAGCPLCCGNPYAWFYAIKIALTLAAMAWVWPGYRRFAFQVSPLALAVGLVGGPLWIALCWPDFEHVYLARWLHHIGLGFVIGDRPAFNPFNPAYDLSAAGAWTFLAVRFLGLVAVVPIIEEFFLRGFVMRFFMQPDWWNVPFGKANRTALVLGTAVPMAMHPELLAAAVWFSLITWLMLRTRNIWDCIAAHALTNLILGIYVVLSGDWRLM